MKSHLLSGQAARALLACALAAPAAAFAQTTFNISFTDPGAAYTSYYADLTRSITAAGNTWLSYFPTDRPTTELSINVNFADIPTLAATSADVSLVGQVNGIDTYGWSAPTKVLTGNDINGDSPDALLYVGLNYLQNVLWYDPTGGSAGSTIPSNKVDAYSAIMHEFGHIWGFNGWRDGSTGLLPGDYQSTFDSLVTLDASAPGGPTLFFTGAHAEAVYGGPVPLTFGNYGHLSNPGARDGNDLLNDLMNGVAFNTGRHYNISALDIAVLQDTGLPLNAMPVPEPGTIQLMLAGLAMALLWRRPQSVR